MTTDERTPALVPRPPLSLTAVGTIRGRVSRPELCLSPVERELGALLADRRVLEGSHVVSVSVVIHLGTVAEAPRIWGIHEPSSELEVAVGVPLATVRRKDKPEVCRIVRSAVLQSLIAACEHLGVPTTALLDAEHGRNPPGSTQSSG